MDKLKFGDIVLLKFPFTDGKTYKKRPALLINDCGDGDIIVCRITTQIYKTDFDIFIDTWENSGLKLPSIIRIHKIVTLEIAMVENIMGCVDNSIHDKIKNLISKLPN